MLTCMRRHQSHQKSGTSKSCGLHHHVVPPPRGDHRHHWNCPHLCCHGVHDSKHLLMGDALHGIHCK